MTKPIAGQGLTLKVTTPTDREIRIAERDGMMSAGMAQGLEQSYTALDKVLAASDR